ncbi:MAG: hypothetical protein ACJAY1_001229, partial [Glaciecola sp.]
NTRLTKTTPNEIKDILSLIQKNLLIINRF